MVNSIDFLMIILMTLFGALGAMFLKKSSNKKSKINIFLFFGLSLYCIGAIINIILLKYIPLTIVFPFNALTYVWTTLIGKYVFKETITKYNVLGLIFISSGLCLLV